MIDKNHLKQLAPLVWQIPKETRPTMQVPCLFFSSERMVHELIRDRSVEQLMNVATLPGIQVAAFGMPDMHEGYGFPIGGVAATSYPDGVISPGGIGYDINCGVRLLLSSLSVDDVRSHSHALAHALYRNIPPGVGQHGHVVLDERQMDNILIEGSSAVIQAGYGIHEDRQRQESFGVILGANPDLVSSQAKKRGSDQLGTLGSGNHFVEVDVVETLFDLEVASQFRLWKDQVVILLHTGSRGLGHQVATDYIRIMNRVMPHYSISLPDRELACVPFSSLEGQCYFQAMAAAANFAFANRQIISHEVRSAWKEVFGGAGGELSLLYDVAHNMAKIEEHDVMGKKEKLIVHRKGATRAFPPSHPELISNFRSTGQPVLIPGSMGTHSYVLVGKKGGTFDAFSSSCHGAGRCLSRHEAKRRIQGRELLHSLQNQGIEVQTGSISDLSEEAPFAYKDVDDVVETVHSAGLAKKVARLKPLIVIKG